MNFCLQSNNSAADQDLSCSVVMETMKRDPVTAPGQKPKLPLVRTLSREEIALEVCPVHHIVIDCSGMTFVDPVGVKILKQVWENRYSEMSM